MSKGFSAAAVAEVLTLGVRDVGENKAQEASAKASEIADLVPELVPRWHFIGQLQRNKARLVAGFATMVHSVDRLALIAALDRGAADRDVALDVLLQIDLDERPAPGRGGVSAADLRPLAEAAVSAPHLNLRGVMAVPPQGADPGAAFARLAASSEALQAIAPSATLISGGMSADLEQAISAGATHVRVGTALFGARKLASD